MPRGGFTGGRGGGGSTGGRGGGFRGGYKGGWSGRPVSNFVSTCAGGGCGGVYGRYRPYDNYVIYPYPFLYYNYASVPYPVAPITNYSIGNPLSYFGSCQAIDGVGVVNQSCAPGLVAIPQAGNQCTCYNRTTGVSGCSNVAGATCSPVPSLYL